MSSGGGGGDGTSNSSGNHGSTEAPADSNKKKLECPVCMDSYDNPHISTKCGHTLCFSCWKQLWDRGTRTCPHCRAPFKMKNLIKNFVVNN